MMIHYFGTGASAGIPEPFCSCRVCTYARAHKGREVRTRTQAAIAGLLIDYPVDAFLHALSGGLDMHAYRHILITHTHSDHYLPEELTSRYQAEGVWHVYLPAVPAARERERIARILADNRSVPPVRIPEIHAIRVFEPFLINDVRVTPLPTSHGAQDVAVMYLIEQNGKAALWAHDTGVFPPETMAYLARLHVYLSFASLDCTLRRGDVITAAHMDLNQCMDTACALRACGCADKQTVFAISHIGHLHRLTHAELSVEARREGFLTAYDGLRIEV